MKNEHALDRYYMRKALGLAKQGLGFTAPNPPVGAVIVRNGEIIGQGYHAKSGQPHAEILALDDAGRSVEGATLYVTLEPCCHEGKTAPCCNTLVNTGLKRVVIGSIDPNPKVSGQGAELLRQTGLEVTHGILQKETDYLIRFFAHFIRQQRPYITLKLALSLDGKIACSTGESKWISGPLSGKYVHALRQQYDAVMVGTNTILSDNPFLTARSKHTRRQPHKIILDLQGRIPKHFNCYVQARDESVFVLMGKSLPDYVKKEVSALPARVVEVQEEMDPSQLFPTILHDLAKKGITSILVEGGSHLAGTLIENGLVEELNFFLAPRIIGEGIPAISGWGVKSLKNAPSVEIYRMLRLRKDYLFKGYMSRRDK